MAKKENNLAALLQQYSAEKEEPMTPTGILPIDKLLGGGLSSGAMYAFWGKPGSFKSTAATQIAKSYCKRGEKVVYIDVEKALNENQQKSFGVREYVQNGTLLHVTADTYSQADELCMAIAADKEMGIKLVIIDSETQLLPKIGEDMAVDSNQPGVKARQASTFLTKTKAAFYNAGITCIVLAHARAEINMQSMYGPDSKMAGGYAMKHVPDAILEFQQGQKLGDDKMAYDGYYIHMQANKCKFAPALKRLMNVKFYFGYGVKKSVYLIDWALEHEVIKQNGSFFDVNGESIRGKDNLYSLDKDKLQWLLSKYNELDPNF